MVVHQRIVRIEYPERIRGEPGEQFEIKVLTRTEGEGENYLYCELLVEEAKAQGETDNPVPPGHDLTWACRVEVLRELPHGYTIHFEVRVGHLENTAKIQDDARAFTVTVVKPLWERVPLWVWGIGLGVPLVVIATLRK